MENVNPKTKQAAGIRATYNYALQYGYSDIWSAYKRPSVYKVRAWYDCLSICKNVDGFNLRIANAGCQFFLSHSCIKVP